MSNKKIKFGDNIDIVVKNKRIILPNELRAKGLERGPIDPFSPYRKPLHRRIQNVKYINFYDMGQIWNSELGIFQSIQNSAAYNYVLDATPENIFTDNSYHIEEPDALTFIQNIENIILAVPKNQLKNTFKRVEKNTPLAGGLEFHWTKYGTHVGGPLYTIGEWSEKGIRLSASNGDDLSSFEVDVSDRLFSIGIYFPFFAEGFDVYKVTSEPSFAAEEVDFVFSEDLNFFLVPSTETFAPGYSGNYGYQHYIDEFGREREGYVQNYSALTTMCIFQREKLEDINNQTYWFENGYISGNQYAYNVARIQASFPGMQWKAVRKDFHNYYPFNFFYEIIDEGDAADFPDPILFDSYGNPNTTPDYYTNAIALSEDSKNEDVGYSERLLAILQSRGEVFYLWAK